MRPLKLVPDNTNIQFLRYRIVALVLSVVLILGSGVLVGVRGLNLGVDFVGGQMLRVQFATPVDAEALRTTVDRLGLGEATIQQFGSPRDMSIRLPLPPGGEEGANRAASQVREAVGKAFPGARFDAVETVSGKVSGELFRTGAWALGLAMLGIALYIWFSFEWQFGVGALFALFHDVALTFGFFALTQLDFDLNVVAAILTIIGYSLNDTIVTYDRIRENLRKYRKMDMRTLLDLSVNETLSRTIVTSLSLIMTLGLLLAIGPDVIFGFTAAMLLGIIIGTFSSIYISAPILLWLNVTGESFVPKSGAEPGAERIGGAERRPD
ncbi:protein translocase subunit SecF [Sphingomonas changnyeongensis]|uniref:Protein-export membrane protein SecF n=1 Tax=Sphingomonas changnyeongensis TaxID=2698679 RepID=A0A7Z2S7E2_9SPHN|nr:protein translocase subunit SecF [Sphingomonas changnyeongensis]QHL90271.1 protein translocase subunit SecF [Sphingomonas changnyeongensis]